MEERFRAGLADHAAAPAHGVTAWLAPLEYVLRAVINLFVP